MKIQKFLDDIEYRLQYGTGVHLPTLKLLLTSFYSFLSNKNQFRWKARIDFILSFTSVQQTIDENLRMNKIKELSDNLHKLKNGN